MAKKPDCGTQSKSTYCEYWAFIVQSKTHIEYMPGRKICHGGDTKTVAGQKSVNVLSVTGELPSEHLTECIRQ
jgi:hypothetical protein